jgi:hypothetical protein
MTKISTQKRLNSRWPSLVSSLVFFLITEKGDNFFRTFVRETWSTLVVYVPSYFDHRKDDVRFLQNVASSYTFTLYNLASIPPAIFCLGNLSQLVIKDGNATIPEDISQLKFLTSLSILRMVRFTYRRQALKIIQQSFFFRRNPAQLQLL